MRQDPESLVRAVEQLSEFYSENLCSVLMLMLQWESEQRPDFITLQTMITNIATLEGA